MKKAIGIRFVPYEESKHFKSHFFGAPLLTKPMLGDFDDQVMFLGMIHLPDIKNLDKENALPHEGYLYFFLDTSGGYRCLSPIVRYVKEEPSAICDDFNELFANEEYPGSDKPRGIEFYEVEEDAEGCKLLGIPCDWNYPDPPARPLLLTLDHYDEGLDFLPQLDGFTYIFFGPKGEEFEGAILHPEYS